jgi:iron complex outermembrane receptor protein
MKMKRNPITNAVQKALFTGFIASSAFGTVALAQDDESVEEQGKITVTGSRIKRSDVEGALPVTVITREQIELSGETNAADFLRGLTFNSAGSFRPQSGSSAQAESSLNLRGIGSARTLVLVDGRRLAKAPGTGQNQDLNTIPMGAIERIEVLSDGASAVYGSDAIGGVVNVITRKDYQGAEIMLGGAEVSIPANGGEREEGSILFGAAGDRSSITVGMSWNDREIIFARDLPWSAGTGRSLFGNNFSVVSPSGGVTFGFIPTANDLYCGFADTTAFFQADDGLCRYDFTQVSADEASIENRSFYAKAEHEVNDNWSLFGNASYSKTNSFGRYAPVPDARFFDDPDNPVFFALTPTSPNNPTNPASPLYDPSLGLEPQPMDWWHRFDAVGPRDSTVGTTLTDMLLGTVGVIGNAEVEFGVRHTNNVRTDVGRNYLLRSVAQQLIESGEYSLANPYGNPDALQRMRITVFRDSKYDQNEYYGNVSFDAFDMTNGPVSVVVGAEYREEKYVDQYDPQSESGAVGGSAGNSAGGNRDVTSLFFEALFPILDNLEMNLAGRYDDYSDFGSEFSPKASFRWQPLDNLTVRASYGQGFRAPTLDVLTQQPSFSADTVRDPVTCELAVGDPDAQCQINALVIGNEELQAETSDQFAIGLAYEPTDWFNMTVDYYDIEIENRIRAFSSQSLIDFPERAPAGLGCTRDESGRIVQCIRGSGNQGEYLISGLDFNFRFNYELFGGNVTNNLQVGHMLEQRLSRTDGTLGDDIVKTPGLPQNRAVLSNTYAYGDWSIAYNINMIGNQDGIDDNEDGDFEDGNDTQPVGTWVTHDIQLNYFAPWDGKFTLGVRNAGEKFPVIDAGNQGSRDYDFNLYDGYGRITYFRYTQTF